MSKNINVVSKGRKQKVPVTIETTKQDEVPTPPAEYQVQDEPIITKTDLVNFLAELNKAEVREIVRAANHLRKVNKFLDTMAEDEEDGDEIDQIVREM